jgi:hypothetical protein
MGTPEETVTGTGAPETLTGTAGRILGGAAGADMKIWRGKIGKGAAVEPKLQLRMKMWRKV